MKECESTHIFYYLLLWYCTMIIFVH